jgi:actin-related protein
MEKIKTIIDFGASEYRIGFSGEIRPYFVQSVEETSSEEEFFTFLKDNLSRYTNVSHLIYLEKNIRNSKLRETVCEQLFEEVNVPNLLILKSGVASLYAIGKSSGTLIENSESSVEMVSIEDGFIDQSQIRRSTFSLKTAISHSKLSDTRRLLRESSQAKSLVLPDGLDISTDKYGFDVGAMIEEFTNRNGIYSNEILLTGRVLNHQAFLTPLMIKIRQKSLIPLNDFGNTEFIDHSNFIGASIVSTINEIDNIYVTAADYKESGIMLLNKQFQ